MGDGWEMENGGRLGNELACVVKWDIFKSLYDLCVCVSDVFVYRMVLRLGKVFDTFFLSCLAVKAYYSITSCLASRSSLITLCQSS
jgi:hypothetical protein